MLPLLRIDVVFIEFIKQSAARDPQCHRGIFF